ncbi:hypothetical protein [Sporomusa malonica]|uniref:Uncharacterized protein n=1 Tax=Sporomusa malonica TaxID=112901 RepID=A0A1W2F240_9FIRM|nr:hypothetical protein [Sporomusa malonica]SMD15566.1 hypothetical protein SAMN04488500_13812 [Sporomusa malonica]
MEKKVIAGIQNDSPAIEWELRSDFDFIRKKHMQAMKAAQELLSSADTYGTTTYDSLNSGKLSRLIDYVKSGSASEE